MKHLLPLLLLITFRLSAQVPDTTWIKDTKFPQLTFVSADSAKWLMRVVGDKFDIRGDTMAVIKAMWKRMRELNSEKSDYITLFVHSYEIITGLPDYLKDTTKHVWREYFTELKRMGYKLPIRKP